MTDPLRAVFMVVAPGSDPQQHTQQLETPVLQLKIVAVKDYDQAVEVTRQCVAQGYSVIELCAGFGQQGVARVSQAAGSIPVGVVRFDHHPLMGHISGDSLF